MKIAFIAMIILIGGVGSVWAQAFTPQASYNAGTKYCSAGFIAQSCPNLSVSKLFVVLADVGFKQRHPEEWNRGCEAGIRDAKKVKTENGNKLLCLTGVVLYGPHGQNVKNMLIINE